MKKIHFIALILLLIGGTSLVVVFLHNRKDSVMNNSVESITERDVFEAAREKAKSFEQIKTTVQRNGSAIDVCDDASPSRCISIKSGAEISEQTKRELEITQSPITLIRKPQKGELFVYPVIADENLVVEFTGSNFIFATPYLKNNGTPYYVGKTNSNHTFYRNNQGDACSSEHMYMIDISMENFPYWITTNFSSNSCNEAANEKIASIEEGFIKALSIEKK